VLLLGVVLGYYGILYLWQDSVLGKIVFANGWTMAFSFFAFFAAIAGLLKIFIDAVVPKGYNKR
jgi:hypothetical protein